MKVLDFIICDDIRREVANKHTIVGAYNDRILLNIPAEIQLPVSLDIAFYLKVDIENNENVNRLHFYFLGNAVENLDGEFAITHIGKDTPLIFLATKIPLVVKQAGKLEIKIVLKNQLGEIVETISPNHRFRIDID